jgi:hypothetical protein
MYQFPVTVRGETRNDKQKYRAFPFIVGGWFICQQKVGNFIFVTYRKKEKWKETISYIMWAKASIRHIPPPILLPKKGALPPTLPRMALIIVGATPVVKSNWPHPRLEGWIAKDRYHSLPFRIVGLWLDRLILLTLDCSEGLLTAEPRKPPTSWTANRESPPYYFIGYRV